MLRQLLSLGLCSSAVWGIYIRDDQPVASYNALAADPFFAAAGYVGVSGLGAICSGTLISPTVVLTAGHCMDYDANGVLDYSAGQLAFGVEPNVPVLTLNVSSVIVHTNWSASGGLVTNDLALMFLSSPFIGVTPAQLGLGWSPGGLNGVMVGYGYQGTGTSATPPAGANNRLAAENRIAGVTVGGQPALMTDFDNPGVTTDTDGVVAPLTLEGTTAPGDSGGPLFAILGGNRAVVGVLHGGYNNFGVDSQYGDVSIYADINVSSNQAFLATYGFTSTPEPGTWALMGASLAAVFWRQRRRTGIQSKLAADCPSAAGSRSR